MHRHDFVQCGCDNETFVDGGVDYIRCGGQELDQIEVILGPKEHKEFLIQYRGWFLKLLGHAIINSIWLDRKTAKNIITKLIDRDGLCPCRIDGSTCPCEFHLKEIEETGHCLCNLFKTVPEGENFWDEGIR